MQQDAGVRGALRGFSTANATRRATRWAEGVQKWRIDGGFSPKPTVVLSVFASFAVRHNGASEHDDLVIDALASALVTPWSGPVTKL